MSTRMIRRLLLITVANIDYRSRNMIQYVAEFMSRPGLDPEQKEILKEENKILLFK